MFISLYIFLCHYLGELSDSPTPYDIRVVKITLVITRWLQTVFAPFTLPDVIAGKWEFVEFIKLTWKAEKFSLLSFWLKNYEKSFWLKNYEKAKRKAPFI